VNKERNEFSIMDTIKLLKKIYSNKKVREITKKIYGLENVLIKESTVEKIVSVFPSSGSQSFIVDVNYIYYHNGNKYTKREGLKLNDLTLRGIKEKLQSKLGSKKLVEFKVISVTVED